MEQNNILKNEQNKGAMYCQKDQIHPPPRTTATGKILRVQSIKIFTRFNNMSTYIKAYFCFANFFVKGKIVNILGFVDNGLFYNVNTAL